jgi:hypothetical protein
MNLILKRKGESGDETMEKREVFVMPDGELRFIRPTGDAGRISQF